MSDLPNGWAWARFEDVADIAQNLVAPSKVLDLPHIAPNHIGSGNRQLLPYSTVRADAVISSKQRFYPGQILFTKIRPYLLKSVLVDFEGVCSADMYPLWTKDTAEPKYLLYWLTSPDFRDVIAHEQGRTVLPKINQAALNRTLMALPPLPEQRRIVAKIENLSANSRRARQHLDHIPRLVEKYKQAILTAAFRGQLQTCITTTLGDCSDFVTSGSRGWAKYYSDTGPKFIRVGNVQRTDISLNWDDTQRVAPPDGSEGQRTNVRPNDLVITITADLGRVGLVTSDIGPAYVNQHVALVRLKAPENGPYLAWYLSSDIGQEQLLEKDRGATRAGLGLEDIRAVSVPEISLKDQQVIVSKIETAFSWIDRLAAETTSARKLIDHLDQAILAKAFRGELVPQDPNDEPASALLERIKAEQTLPVKRRPKARKTTAVKKARKAAN
ncbi:hypothetical protein GWE18_06600 [Bradyrhizobium sp. CSA112]|uniref:restriction endonuclease subunit S n=1 Tax=Bradyrhizobium sp. CSA112 TaxID=2699170 RepID=UPI0023AF7304|nr:restriction endonuclease subunit S [Bradyrhizobium sp. CSA112]MDE5452544.1 hypothetical protein [Bradyrhizobium sp. CSA112]